MLNNFLSFIKDLTAKDAVKVRSHPQGYTFIEAPQCMALLTYHFLFHFFLFLTLSSTLMVRMEVAFELGKGEELLIAGAAVH